MRTSDVGSTPTRGARSSRATKGCRRATAGRRHRPRRGQRHPDEVQDDEGSAPPGGRSMIGHVVPRPALHLEPHRLVAVVGQRPRAGRSAHPVLLGPRRSRRAGDPGGHRPRGPGGAGVERDDRAAPSLVATGDTPLLEGDVPAPRSWPTTGRPSRSVSILSGVVADPFGYGRIVRNDEGDVEAIVEEKDATARAARDPGDQLGDPRLRRRVPGRGAAAADQRQRQGRVLPHRHRADRPRGRPDGRRLRDRRRAPDRGRQRPRPARRAWAAR